MQLREIISFEFGHLIVDGIPDVLLDREVGSLLLDEVHNLHCEHLLSLLNFEELVVLLVARRCRVCGCTEYDCHQCIEKTGGPCDWVEDDLCSACKE